MINLCLAYYDQPKMLAFQLNAIKSWSCETLEKFRLIIVDDGSPEYPAESIVRAAELRFLLGDLQLYRIREDKAWNQDGARNLAMSRVVNEWCILTDMDHILTEEVAKRILEMPKNQGVFYVPARKRGLATVKPHPNSYIIHSDDFWKTGGYDEDYVGFYGSDSVFRRQLNCRFAEKRLDSNYALQLIEPDVVADAMTTRYGRKGSDYCIKRSERLMQKANSGPYKAANPCRFNWDLVVL